MRDDDLAALIRRTEAWMHNPGRLERLREYGVLESQGSPRLTELCDRVTREMDVLAAAATVIDGDAQCFLAISSGIELQPMNLDSRQSFCRFVGSTGETFRVDYAPENAIVCDLDTVTQLGIHAYLGVPLVAPNGEVIGSFCVFEDHLRAWTDADELRLKDYSVLATAILITEQRDAS